MRKPSPGKCHSPGEGEYTNIQQYSHFSAVRWKSPLLLSCLLIDLKLAVPWEFTCALLVLALGWQGMRTDTVLPPHIVLQHQMHEAMLNYPSDAFSWCCPTLACALVRALAPLLNVTSNGSTYTLYFALVRDGTANGPWLSFIKQSYLECLRKLKKLPWEAAAMQDKLFIGRSNLFCTFLSLWHFQELLKLLCTSSSVSQYAFQTCYPMESPATNFYRCVHNFDPCCPGCVARASFLHWVVCWAHHSAENSIACAHLSLLSKHN